MTRPVVGYAADYPSGHVIRRHRHAAGQLIYAASGVMTVTTAAGRWVVPPERAVWVPPRVAHAIRMTGVVGMRTLYLDPPATTGLPAAPAVVQVRPLLRELIVAAVAFRQPYDPDGPEARIVAVLLDELEVARTAPLHVPVPRDPRLRAITDRLLVDPSDGRTLSAWARTAGASARTLARLFRRETGLGFGDWRREARLLHALERLAAGEAVTTVALELGYDGPSAFIAMFRARLGTTPGRYFDAPPRGGQARAGQAQVRRRRERAGSEVARGARVRRR